MSSSYSAVFGASQEAGLALGDCPAIPTVLDMSIVGDWNISITKGVDKDRIDHAGRVEVALFAKILPAPGTALKLLHLNKNMLLKHKDYRVIPLLPDGSSPRMAPGSQALGIPVASGSCWTTSDGKGSPWLPTVDEDHLDGVRDSNDAASESSMDAMWPSALDLTQPPARGNLGNLCTNIIHNDGPFDNTGNWAEICNSGTRLVDRHDFLYIEFEDNVCLDAIVVEIYLDVEPMKLEKDDEYCFIFGPLPYCQKGINISLGAENESTRSELIFETEPSLENTVSSNRNLLSGTYVSSSGESDTLTIHAHFVPYRYDAKIKTKVQVTPFIHSGLVTFRYTVKVVFNEQALGAHRNGKLELKVLDILPNDYFNLREGFGNTQTEDSSRYSRDGSTLYIQLEPNDCFKVLKFEIVATRSFDLARNMIIPRIVPIDRYLIEQIVLLERLGDQPLKWVPIDIPGNWRTVLQERTRFDRAFWTMFYAQTVYEPLRVTVEKDLACPDFSKQLPEDKVIESAIYTLWMESSSDSLRKQLSGSVSLEISYKVFDSLHNERVFTIDSGECQLDRSTMFFSDSRGTEHRLHEIRDQNGEKKWIIKNNQLGISSENRKSVITMVSVWDLNGLDSVSLGKDGRVLRPEETGDKYDCFTLPSVIDRSLDHENIRFHIKNKIMKMDSDETGEAIDFVFPDVAIGDRLTLYPHNYSQVDHLCRSTLLNEIYRDKTLYVTKENRVLKIYIPYLDVSVTGGGDGKGSGTVDSFSNTLTEIGSESDSSFKNPNEALQLDLTHMQNSIPSAQQSTHVHATKRSNSKQIGHSNNELPYNGHVTLSEYMHNWSGPPCIDSAQLEEEVAKFLRPKKNTTNAVSISKKCRQKVKHRHKLVAANGNVVPPTDKLHPNQGRPIRLSAQSSSTFSSQLQLVLLSLLTILFCFGYLNLAYSQERLMVQIVSLRYEVTTLTNNLKSCQGVSEDQPQDFVFRIHGPNTLNSSLVIDSFHKDQGYGLNFNKQETDNVFREQECYRFVSDKKIANRFANPHDSYMPPEKIEHNYEDVVSNSKQPSQFTTVMITSLQSYEPKTSDVQIGIFAEFKRLLAEIWGIVRRRRPGGEAGTGGTIGDKQERLGEGNGRFFSFFRRDAEAVRLFL